MCSSSGGRPHDTQRSTSYDPGVLIKRTYTQAYATSHRYYYDTEQGRCMSFTYNGAMGNFNNFKSASECEMFCAKLQCNYGTPLKIGPNNQRCTTNSDCPSTHECQTDHNVCCPRPRKIYSNKCRKKKWFQNRYVRNPWGWVIVNKAFGDIGNRPIYNNS